ncbi:DUF2493 domain-containing protein [Mesorhizobium sp. WSM4303]|nr:DUF2493 domain-containing protein [Mesorhizobium sp. WSM4306]TRD05926.1 DUF2493 domain-containing protein [Mesorhizobium sp. WSM4303]
MIVLVCGGRGFGVPPTGTTDLQSDFDINKAARERCLLYQVLDRLNGEHHFSIVVHGDAIGADRLAGAWAESRQIPVRAFPADWETHRRAAGPIRNKQMLDEGTPDLVFAFPGGRGTANMVLQSRNAGVLVIEVEASHADQTDRW